jgi:hypothetical protein
MTPTTDERLASIVRSLTEVILPHLPAEASLAQEQVQLAIGHLQILRAQIDHIPAYERGELDDAVAIAKALTQSVSGGAETSAALSTLQAIIDAADHDEARAQTVAINVAVDALVKAAAVDGAAGANHQLSSIILKFEHTRSQKDRRWFLAYGFDTMAEGE